MDRKLIGEYLLSERAITPQELERALESQGMQNPASNPPLLGTILVEMGALKLDQLKHALDRQQQDRQAMM